MERAKIEAAVIEILAQQLLLQPDEIAAEAVIDDLGLDSLGKVEAIFALEERFDISIPFNANEPDQPDFDFSSVPRIVVGVERLIAQRAA
ncbi:MAG: phosphopantetheine-binding protein [Tabrizicola sp.]|uniref:acyl carrier protein n=1 Tax=Tabrizicola sp. TaxID=2005166 RepID=UPI002AB92C14|nr:phosphopantetheine-binding protein [Tabrizicola sp.]MDZ4087559.1 phosphopantetheine-binding protein [Tabrizicola sp.]